MLLVILQETKIRFFDEINQFDTIKIWETDVSENRLNFEFKTSDE